MSSFQWGNLIYLILLLAMILFWFVIQNRGSLGKMAQQALAWGLIFVGVIAAIGVWDDIRHTMVPTQGVLTETGQIEVPRARDGHYYLTLGINGKPVDFLVDTGASQVVLSQSDAERLGLVTSDLAYTGRAMTANGEVRTAPVRLDTVELGPVVDRDVRAWVNEGEMDKSLLGMTYLQRWSRIEIADGALLLSR
ncbi:retropepsin-like aspartic protease family protein [Sedimentitalea arenosa]|jgi:aspartyl protease family protein|uniref:TIGR02281 family clan AA aspartic protease n=1 Tax=Sedimentitalea arenosa TaxID=2798803 RepID=A0A8J7J9M6_9RHOB|nr:TIGR02281 family clan AA aspartic protease [Arenibacterium arenosum]MBJ6373372.1 TIGR02281 family clan AA aspartic protease [Arenibacterium arenosum]